MLGFKTIKKTIEVGDVLVDNTTLCPWGSPPKVVLEVLPALAHPDLGQFLYPSSYGRTRVRVLSYHMDGRRNIYVTWAGNRQRPVVATLDEYLEARADARAKRPRWTKEECGQYQTLVRLTAKEHVDWTDRQVRRNCRDRVDACAAARIQALYEKEQVM